MKGDFPMNNLKKISAVVLVIVMLLAVGGCGKKPDYSYKTESTSYVEGVYIYSLRTAYSQAQTFAQDVEGYDESTEAWLDLEITDDDGDKAVAREWIKNEADTMCLNYIAVDNLVEELGIDMSGATADQAKKSAEEYWTVGPYASYGYYMPYRTNMSLTVFLLKALSIAQHFTTQSILQFLTSFTVRAVLRK